MTIHYSDWVTGDDTTGDGSAGNPYKTVNKASTGLTGGDEVRIAKSPDNTVLSGTCTFTDGSNTISTSVDLTTEISIGDFIGKTNDDDMFWEITNVTATTITLLFDYIGTSETVVSYKMGYIDLGTAASTSTQIDIVNASGTSTSSKLKISGGWNLTTETQTHYSTFMQTGAAKNGYFLYINGKNYLEVEKIRVARVNRYYAAENFSVVSDIHVYSTGSYNYYLVGHDNEYYRYKGNFSDADGLYVNGYNNFLLECESLSSNSEPVYIPGYDNIFCSCVGDNPNASVPAWLCTTTGTGNKLLSCTGNRGTYGFNFGSIQADMGVLSANNNTTAAIFINGTYPIMIQHLIESGNPTIVTLASASRARYKSIVNIQRYNNTQGSKIYYKECLVEKNTAEARSNSCLKFTDLDSSIQALSYFSLGKYYVTSTASNLTLKVYLKDDVSFNGTVKLGALVLGDIVVDWTEKVLTNSYVEYSIEVTNTDLVQDEWVELVLWLSGTAGSVYADDFSVS